MPFPDITGLPAWAQVSFIIAFGLGLALIFFVTRFGIQQGQKTASTSPQTAAQVAAVIVDPTALNKATASVENLTIAVTRAAAVARNHSKNTERLAEELDKVREELRIQREIRNRN